MHSYQRDLIDKSKEYRRVVISTKSDHEESDTAEKTQASYAVQNYSPNHCLSVPITASGAYLGITYTTLR